MSSDGDGGAPLSKAKHLPLFRLDWHNLDLRDSLLRGILKYRGFPNVALCVLRSR